MILYGYYDKYLDKEMIILLLAEWNTEDCMDAPPMIYMREPHDLKSQIHYPDAPTYVELLSGKHSDEY